MRQGKEGGCKQLIKQVTPGGPYRGPHRGAVDNMHLRPSRTEQPGTRGAPHLLTGSRRPWLRDAPTWPTVRMNTTSSEGRTEPSGKETRVWAVGRLEFA